MCSAATAVLRNQLLPVDGIANAGKPFEKAYSDMLRLEMPTTTRNAVPNAILSERPALEHVPLGKLVGGPCCCIVRGCGHGASMAAAFQVPLATASLRCARGAACPSK